MLQTTGILPTARRQKTSWVGRNLSLACYTAGVKGRNVGKWGFPDILEKQDLLPPNNNSF